MGRHRKVRRWLLVPALVIAVAGCGAPAPGGSSAGGPVGASVEGRTFVATGATEQGAPRALVGRVALDFTQADRLTASTGCNSGWGTVRFEGDRLVSEDLAVTAIGCPADFAAQERFVFGFLAAGPTVAVTGDDLVLRTATAELRLLDRRVADPDRPLQGTRWTIDGTFDAAVASSAASSGPRGFLVIDAGRVTGSTGCRTFEGPATVSATQVSFGPLTLAGPACPPDEERTEQAVLAVLRGTATASITARSLRLTQPDGRGISLQAD